MAEFVPELGQLAFGQQHQRYAVPPIMEAVLSHIEHALSSVMWNIHQEEYHSPFGNNGAHFKNDVFEVESYSWGAEPQDYNFAWKDLRISWYKRMGRGMSANMEITPDLAAQCLEECLASIDAMDTDNLDA